MNKNTKDVEKMTGFRKATDDEAKGIYQYMRNYYRKFINIYMISFGICLDYDLFFCLLYVKRCVSIYKKRQYRVLEGYVSEVSTNANYNTGRLKFNSKNGQCLDRWYDFDTTDCNIGDRLLLVDPNPWFLGPHILKDAMLGK